MRFPNPGAYPIAAVCVCALALPFTFSAVPLDPFHAWRWSLLAFFAAAGAAALCIGGKGRPVPMPAGAAIALCLAGGALCFSVLSRVAASDKPEWAWQTAQTAAWSAWFWIAVAEGTRSRRFWIRVRRLAVTVALLGGAYAAGEYWGFWSWTAGSGNGPGGLHGNRNLLASFQLLLCPWVVWSIADEAGGFRFAALAAWAGFGYTLAITQCRAAWLGTAVFALAALAWVAYAEREWIRAALKAPRGIYRSGAGKRVRVWLFIAAALPTAFCLHAWEKPGRDNRVGSLERLATVAEPGFDSNAERLALWGKTLQLIGTHPWLGVGAGNWKVALASVGLSGLLKPDLSVTEVRPYNDWLWVAAETGIPGGLCWAGIGMVALASGWLGARAARKATAASRAPGEWGSRLGLPLLGAGLLGFAAVSALDFPRERAEHMTWYALSLAALLTLGRNEREPQRAEARGRASTRQSRLGIRLPAAAALLIAGAATGFSFLRWHQEGFVREAFQAQRSKDWPGLLAAVAQLDPRLCDMSPAASPMAWHEGVARYQLGDRPGAEAAFARALQAHPYHLHVLYDLSVCRLAAGDTVAARGYLARVLAISPGFTTGAIQSALLAARQGEIGPARKALAGVPPEIRTEKWRALDGALARYERNNP